MQFVTIKAAPMMSILCKANVVVSNVSSCDKTNIYISDAYIYTYISNHVNSHYHLLRIILVSKPILDHI